MKKLTLEIPEPNGVLCDLNCPCLAHCADEGYYCAPRLSRYVEGALATCFSTGILPGPGCPWYKEEV